MTPALPRNSNILTKIPAIYKTGERGSDQFLVLAVSQSEIRQAAVIVVFLYLCLCHSRPGRAPEESRPWWHAISQSPPEYVFLNHGLFIFGWFVNFVSLSMPFFVKAPAKKIMDFP